MLFISLLLLVTKNFESMYSVLKNKSADVSIIFGRLQNCIEWSILYKQAFIQKSNAKIKARLSQDV